MPPSAAVIKKHPTAKLPGYPDTGVIIEPQQMRRMDALLKKLDTSCAARLAKNIERLKTAQKGCFCVRNGSATPREEGLAKQTQVRLLGGWSADDVTAEANPVSIKWSRCWTVSHKQNGSLW